MKLIEIISSDKHILDRTKRDGNFFVFDHEEFGQQLKGQVPPKLDASVLAQWCSFIRAQYKARLDPVSAPTERVNERQDSEAVAEDGADAVVQGARAEDNADAGERSGGRPSIQASAAGAQASVEDYLETQIAAAHAASISAEERSDSHRAEADRLAAEARGWAAIRDALSASPGRRANRAASPPEEVQARAEAGADSSVVPRPVPGNKQGRRRSGKGDSANPVSA